MNDLFNNFDIEVINGSFVSGKGIVPDEDKEMIVLFKPKEIQNMELLTFNYEDGKAKAFTVSCEGGNPAEIGVCEYVNGEIDRRNYILFDNLNEEVVYVENIEGNREYSKIPLKYYSLNINTVGILNSAKKIAALYEGIIVPMSELHLPVKDFNTCMYIKSKHTLVSAFYGIIDFNFSKIEDASAHLSSNLFTYTQRPNYFIRNIDE